MKWIYSLGVWSYFVAVWIVSWWNPKAKKWITGRRSSKKILSDFSQKIASQKTDEKLYWFHCASLGEFEQGRPLIEALKQKESCRIAISFFSPSGYELRKNYDQADVVFYLPVDSSKNARRVLDLLQPSAVFFIKYEFWAHYILESKKRAIPVYSVSAVFRKNQIFFRWYGGFMRKILKSFSMIFVQDTDSLKLIQGIGLDAIVSGDTRYDRVTKNAAKVIRYPLMDVVTEGHRVFVCGSLWDHDLVAVHQGLKKLGSDWKIILTTHEVDEAHLKEAESFFDTEKLIRYSRLKEENTDVKFILIDNVGMLMNLYGYGDLAYVGGAFKTGLHNILEPAAFGLPVIFGPNHEKFPEASLFLKEGVGFSIQSAPDFEKTLIRIEHKDLRKKVIDFIASKTGATDEIVKSIANAK